MSVWTVVRSTIATSRTELRAISESARIQVSEEAQDRLPGVGRRLARVLVWSALAIGLTILTQIGGLALLACRRGGRLWRRGLRGLGAYFFLWMSAHALAPSLGRVPLPCWGTGSIRPATRLTCLANRHYVRPALLKVLQRAARSMKTQDPIASLIYLDANFPFFDGFPLLPHLSHSDGRKIDLGFVYQRPGVPSPIGYWAYVPLGPKVRAACPDRLWDLRWDFDRLQPLFSKWQLDARKTRTLIRALTEQREVSKVLLEPHLRARMKLDRAKVRFQGCRAARHDDHLHVQIRRR